MTSLYRGLVISRVKKALHSMKIAEKLQHQGVKGRAREIFLSDIFRPYLYPTNEICTGIIIDAKEQQSKQMDIIIFDRDIVPPMALSEGEGIIPYESVLATIEVKSTLTRKNLKDSILNAISIRKLTMDRTAWPLDVKNEEIPDANFLKPASTLFAYKSDLRGNQKDELDRYFDLLKELTIDKTNPPLHAICIAQKCCLAWIETRGKKNWRNIQNTKDHDEILYFLMTIIDTIQSIMNTRGKPNIGIYIGKEKKSK
jgi:hypothetical protein